MQGGQSMNKENNHGNQSFINGSHGPLTCKSRTSENACENEETSSDVKSNSEFTQADARLLPYHLYFSSKL
jgi:hypothetical protein